jgi:hypothetical protein
MVSKEKYEEAVSLNELYGPETAAKKMGVSSESFHRYLRLYKDVDDTLPRVLLVDIETAPIVAYSWGAWNVNISIDQIKDDWFMLGWSAKYLFDSKTFSDIVTPGEAMARDDQRIVQSLWEQMNDADIVIGHNARKFDVPMMNTRFLVHKLPPPLPYRIVDTRDILRKNFRFVHNKLDYVNRVLGLSRKLDTGGFGLWLECMAGDSKALAKMQVYNKKDVGILEELYVAIRGWAKSHPNMGMYMEGNGIVCPVCGSGNLGYGGYYYCDTNKYRAFRCNDCGAIGRSQSASGKKKILKSVAR